MASGDSLVVWDALSMRPPSSAPPGYFKFPIQDQVAILFDDVVGSFVYCNGVLPDQYAGGDMTARLFWVPAIGSGNVQWDGYFDLQHPTTFDFSDGGWTPFGPFTPSPVAVTAAMILVTTDIIIPAASAGNPVAGDQFRIALFRDTGTGGNMADDAYVTSLHLFEA